MRPDCKIAGRTEEAGLPRRGVRAAFQPAEECAWIGRFDLRRPLEAHVLGRCRHAPAQAHLGEAWTAELERFDIPAVIVELDVATHVLKCAGRKRHRVDADPEPHRE